MFDVIKALFFREAKTKFGSSKYGYFSAIFEPGAHFLTMLVVFSFIRRTLPIDIPFSIFLLTGMLPYFLFRDIVFGVMDGSRESKNLFSYRPVKPIDVYITRTIFHTITYVPMMVFVIIGLGLIIDTQIWPVDFIRAFFSLLLLIFFSFSLGLSLALLVNLYPTSRKAVMLVFKFLYFASAIMYPFWIFPEPYREYLTYNPVLQILELFRQNFFEFYPDNDYINVYYPLSLTAILLYVGLWFYHKRRYHLAVII